jgi:nucleoside-diphosphate-sugar epimerase
LTDWNGRRVFVTGATGFIGRRLVRKLYQAEAEVWAGIYPDDAAPSDLDCLPEVESVPFNIEEESSVTHAVDQAKPEVVFHLAAAGATDPNIDPRKALRVNVDGLISLLEALLGTDVQRVVLTGTCHEYGAQEAREGLDPFNAYAASKVAAWAFGRSYWRMHGLPIVTVRPFQVYGPGQPAHTLVPSAIDAALNGEDFAMTAGEQARDFVYVDDVIEGMMAAAMTPAVAGRSLDLGTGKATSIREVVERIWERTGAPGEIQVGALPYRTGEVIHLVADAERAYALTGWRARVSLDEGLEKTIYEF